jgi:hypothetical protein
LWLSLVKTSSASDCSNVAIPEDMDDTEGTLSFCTELEKIIEPFPGGIELAGGGQQAGAEVPRIRPGDWGKVEAGWLPRPFC